MNNIIADKDSILEKFADTVYNRFKQIRYGISCGPMSDFNRLRDMKTLVCWQSKLESNIVNETDITLISDLPAFKNSVPFIIGGLSQRNQNTIRLQYDVDQSGITVDSDGCKTEIIINPGVCEGRQGFEFQIDTPNTVWHIVHNLGYVPNVRTENLAGNDIDGIVNPIDINTIEITFSTAVAGKAYLS